MSNRIVLVTGSRSVAMTTWVPIVRSALNQCKTATDNMIVMHGACPHPKREQGEKMLVSIDMLADEWAREFDINVLKFPAVWRLGKNAGLERNRFMVETLASFCSDLSWGGVVMAFSSDIDRTGTGHCVRQALKHGFFVQHYDGENAMEFLYPELE